MWAPGAEEFAHELAGQRVLVTGGSGFIGTNLVSCLKAMPLERLLSLDIAAPRNPANVDVHCEGDILDAALLAKTFERFSPTVVIHLAARTDLDGTCSYDYLSNTVGTRNVITAIGNLHDSPRATLFASSRLVCSIGYRPRDELDFAPSTAYGQSKVEAEQIVREYAGNQFPWAIFRPTSIWGEWFEVPYRTFFDSVRSGRYVHPAGVCIPKSFGYVGNSVYQILAAASGLAKERLLDGRVFYLCDYEELDVECWANEISAAFGRGTVRRVPLSLLKGVACIGDLVERISGRRLKAPITSFRLNNLTTPMLHDSWGIEKLVPKLPFERAVGVERTVSWMRGNWQADKGR